MWGYCLFPLVFLGLLQGLLWGEVDLSLIHGRPVVDGVYVNGHGPYRFLVDTGSDANELSPDVAYQAGLRATFRKQLITAAGTNLVPGRGGLTVRVGDVWAEEQEFLFTGMQLFRGMEAGIQGILGQTFLVQFDYLLDLHGKRLSFGQHEVAGNRAPIQMVHGRMAVRTSLGDLVVDSGADRLALFGVRVFASTENYIRTLTGTEPVGLVWSLLAIEGRRVWRGEALAIRRHEEEGVAGLMPVNLFRAVYVCNSEQYLVFQ